MAEAAAKLRHEGSVKNFYLYEGREPTDVMFGRGYLEFREGIPGNPKEDSISVFDYGVLPWGVPHKGVYMCDTAKKCFRLFDREGIPHHMAGKSDNPRHMEVFVARIPPNYDWIEGGKTVNYMIPLEVIFTSTLLPISSLHRDLRSGKKKPGDYGLPYVPEKGEVMGLPVPVIRWSTKIEAVDDYREGIDVLAGLVGNEGDRLKELCRAAREVVTADAAEVGLKIADGKIEAVMDRFRNMRVCDTHYTSDENRILYQLPNGRWVDLSKQFPRNVYTIMGWKKELKAAQKEFPDEKGRWPAPPLLPEGVKELIGDTYRVVHDAICRTGSFDKELGPVAQRVADTLDRLKEEHKRDETGADL